MRSCTQPFTLTWWTSCGLHRRRDCRRGWWSPAASWSSGSRTRPVLGVRVSTQLTRGAIVLRCGHLHGSRRGPTGAPAASVEDATGGHGAYGRVRRVPLTAAESGRRSGTTCCASSGGRRPTLAAETEHSSDPTFDQTSIGQEATCRRDQTQSRPPPRIGPEPLKGRALHLRSVSPTGIARRRQRKETGHGTRLRGMRRWWRATCWKCPEV